MLMSTPYTGCPVSRRSPPIAGPSTTIMPSNSAKMAFAAIRSDSGTTSGISAPDAGFTGV